MNIGILQNNKNSFQRNVGKTYHHKSDGNNQGNVLKIIFYAQNLYVIPTPIFVDDSASNLAEPTKLLNVIPFVYVPFKVGDVYVLSTLYPLYAKVNSKSSLSVIGYRIPVWIPYVLPVAFSASTSTLVYPTFAPTNGTILLLLSLIK